MTQNSNTDLTQEEQAELLSAPVWVQKAYTQYGVDNPIVKAWRNRNSINKFNPKHDPLSETTIPKTPKGTAPINNELARSPLFSPIQKGRRNFRDNELLISHGGVEIRYTGKRLDMSDQDVLLNALRYAATHQPDSDIRINRSKFLSEIGIKKAGASYKQLEDKFRRLGSAIVTVKTKSYYVQYPLLGGILIDEYSGELIFSIPKRSLSFFIENAFGYVNMERRIALEHKKDLAKWIQSYSVSHAKGKHVVDIHELYKITGAISELKKFKFNLKEALQELVRVGEFEKAEIRADGKVEWFR